MDNKYFYEIIWKKCSVNEWADVYTKLENKMVRWTCDRKRYRLLKGVLPFSGGDFRQSFVSTENLWIIGFVFSHPVIAPAFLLCSTYKFRNKKIETVVKNWVFLTQLKRIARCFKFHNNNKSK